FLGRRILRYHWAESAMPELQFEAIAVVVQPPVRVLATVAARRPASAAYGEINLPTCLIEFLSDLRAGLRASHHEHRSRPQLLRVAVGVGVDLHDVRWEIGAECGDLRFLIETRCHHHVARSNSLAALGCHNVSSALGSALDAAYRCAITDRQAEPFGVVF